MMYLHIGKDVILNINEIIGIFDIETLKKSKSYDNIIEKAKVVERLSDNEKSLILTNENCNLKAYISNILSTTIANRSNL